MEQRFGERPSAALDLGASERLFAAATLGAQKFLKTRHPSSAQCRQLVRRTLDASEADEAAAQLAQLAEHRLDDNTAAAERLLTVAVSQLTPVISPIGQLPLTRIAYRLARMRARNGDAIAALLKLAAIAGLAFEPADGKYSTLLAWVATELRSLGDIDRADDLDYAAAAARQASGARSGGLSLTKSRTFVPGLESAEEKTTPVTVHFATTRAIDHSAAWAHPYSCELSPDLSFGTARVIVPLDKNLEHIRAAVRRGQPGFARRIPFRRGKTELDIVWPQSDEATFWRDLRLTVTKRARREVLIYIHGFNTPFEKGIERAGHLHAALEIQGATIAFSWPSLGCVFKYGSDAQMVRDMSRDPLVATICRAVELADAKIVHVVAHSMGSRVALGALVMMHEGNVALPGGAKFGHVVLAAADVPRDEYIKAIPKLGPLAERVTLYASKWDRALWAARLADGKPRAGDAGRVTIVRPSETVDTSRASGGPLGHSDFDGTALDDARALLWFGIAPRHRAFLEPQRSLAGTSWRFRKLNIIDRDLLWCRAGLIISRLAGCERAHAILENEIAKLNPVADKRLHTDLSRTLVASQQACQGRVTLHYAPEERDGTFK